MMVEQKIKQILVQNIRNNKVLSDNWLSMKISDIGIDSILYIKIIVAVEEEFGFEFEDNDLDYNKIQYIKDLVLYVEQKIKQNNYQ